MDPLVYEGKAAVKRQTLKVHMNYYKSTLLWIVALLFRVLLTVGRTGACKWTTDGILRLRIWCAVTSLMDIFPRSLITESSWPKEYLTGFPFHPLTVNTGQIVLIFIYNR